MQIYLAGPITGLSYEQVIRRYKEQTTKLERLGYKVVTPMAGKGDLRTEVSFKSNGYSESPICTDKAIKSRDRWMVGQSDIILVDFRQSGERVSIGTCFEMAWADELKKHIVVIMPPHNIHKHSFVLQCSNIIFETEEEAHSYLGKLVSDVKVL